MRPAADFALAIARFNGINPTVTSALRTFTEQSKLRRKFERCVAEERFPGPGCRFPANRPGDSAHNYGLAFDSVVPREQLAVWTAIRRYVGFEVPDNDVIHGQVPGWRRFVNPPPRSTSS